MYILFVLGWKSVSAQCEIRWSVSFDSLSHIVLVLCVSQITPLKEKSPEPEKTTVIQVCSWVWIIITTLLHEQRVERQEFRFHPESKKIILLNSLCVTEWEEADSAPTQPEPESPGPGGGWGGVSSEPRPPTEPACRRDTPPFEWRPEEVGCGRTSCASCGSAHLRGNL